MRLKLFLSILFFCSIIKGQVNSDLKEFINKNNVAIRSVQKNMIRENNFSFVSTFKELVKNQTIAVKLYNTDKDASSYYAYIVRNASLEFMKKNTTGSTEYFQVTDSEKTFLKSSIENANTKALTASEIKAIDELDAINPKSLNNLSLTIQ